MPPLPHQQLHPSASSPHHHHNHHPQPYPHPVQRPGMSSAGVPAPPALTGTGREPPYHGHSHPQHSHGNPMSHTKQPPHHPYHHHHSSSYHHHHPHNQLQQQQQQQQQIQAQPSRHTRTLSSSSSSSSSAPYYPRQPSSGPSHAQSHIHLPGSAVNHPHPHHLHARHPSSSSTSFPHSHEHSGHHRSNSSSMVSHPAAQQHSMSQQPQPSRGVYHNPYSGANDYPPHLSTHHRHATPHHQRHESFHAQDAVVPQQHPSPQRAFPIQKIAEAASAKAVEVEAVTVARGMEVDDEEDEEDDGEITQGSKSNNQDSGTNHSRDIKNMAEDKQASMLAPENKSQRSGSISEDGQEIHKCSSCGKVYKHLNCLTKHRWEHSKYWKSATKFYLSKHQQVRMMEAAAILLGLDSGRNSDDDEIVGSVINGRIQSFGPSTTIPASRSPPSPPVRSHSGAGHDDESLVMLEKEMRPREKKPASLTKAQSMTDGDMAPMAVIMPKKEEDQQRTNLESATTTITAAAATTVVSPQAMSDAGSMSGSPPSLVPDDRSSTSSSMSSRSSQDDDTLMTEAAKLVDIGKSVPSSELTPKVAAPARGGYGHFQHQHHVTQGERYAPGPHYGHPSSPLMLNNNHHHPRYANHPHLSKSESYNPAPQPSPPGVASTRKPVYSSQELY